MKAHADASDAAEALAEAASLSKTRGRAAEVRRFADSYRAKHADGEAAGAMRLARAEALRDLGDGAGAEAALREVIAKAGDDINGLVEATTTLASMLVDGGKEGDAKTLLDEVGQANASAGSRSTSPRSPPPTTSSAPSRSRSACRTPTARSSTSRRTRARSSWSTSGRRGAARASPNCRT